MNDRSLLSLSLCVYEGHAGARGGRRWDGIETGIFSDDEDDDGEEDEEYYEMSRIIRPSAPLAAASSSSSSLSDANPLLVRTQ